MEACPNCATQLEPFEVHCHGCGHVTSQIAVPVAENLPVPSAELEEASKSWLDKGREALNSANFEQAAACFHEALKRVRALENAQGQEVEVRNLLAEALEKDQKLAEAAEQYEALSKIVDAEEMGAAYRQRAETLDGQADVIVYQMDASDYKPVSAEEARIVPLYCSTCRRMLTESEVFGFRKGSGEELRCLCGAEGRPLTKQDGKYLRAVREAQRMQGRKEKLLAAANVVLPGGKKKGIAALLALFLGNFGVHKFYLGERDAGLVYLLLCWSLVPGILSLFEAVYLWQMSLVTFNLSYNVELVIGRIPAESLGQAKDDVFSMHITEDPEDFIDEYTEPRAG